MFSVQITAYDTGKTAGFWTLMQAKNGSITASENGILLHSSYNPERESLQAARQSDFESCTTAVFYGFGLGYTPAAYAQMYPDRTLIIIEPDPEHFFAALTILDWTPVFTCPSCIIALSCTPETIIPLIEQSGTEHCASFSVSSQTSHSQRYFDTVRTLVDRNKRKDEINNATLERFGKLWLRNSCKNIKQYSVLSGVNIYAGKGQNLPFTIIAAGPSLDETLPWLSELKKRSVVVCVDTALRACLRSGTEPDFIVIADPQYYAYRHIAGLASPSSVLITESAVYPAVYRFPCRKIVLCSSLFPLGQWFEKRLGKKGDLGAGGSVASSAWNFAYLSGSREIYTAGLDLSYPGRKTHITGSTFEQAVHTASLRTRPAETANLPALFSGGTEYGKDYCGAPVLTDSRMKMFAWWFESRLAACPDAKTYTFGKKGLAIPGIVPADIQTLLSKTDISTEKRFFFEQSENTSLEHLPALHEFDAVFCEFTKKLSDLYDTAKKGRYLCEKALSSTSSNLHSEEISSILSQLAAIDAAIQQSSLETAASLVFPTSRQLKKLETAQQIPSDPYRASLAHSLLIYTELCRALGEYHNLLVK